MPPLVTIGIPFFNSAKYLSDAIKSTINQTYPNLEIILLDDGSSDTSLDIARDFEKIDQRVRVISDGKNLGLPKRLNQLSQLANGKFYARMDADDIMFINRIAEQVKYLLKNPEVDLLGTGLVAIDNDNTILGLRRVTPLHRVSIKSTLKGPWAAHPSITGKTDWFKEHKYDETLRRSQDFELWIRTVEKSNFTRIETPLLFYREASTSSMTKRIKATNYSIKTFWKNRQKIGLLYCLTQIVISVIKLIVYFGFFIFGSTEILIKNRSVKLLQKEKDFFINQLTKSLQTKAVKTC